MGCHLREGAHRSWLLLIQCGWTLQALPEDSYRHFWGDSMTPLRPVPCLTLLQVLVKNMHGKQMRDLNRIIYYRLKYWMFSFIVSLDQIMLHGCTIQTLIICFNIFIFLLYTKYTPFRLIFPFLNKIFSFSGKTWAFGKGFLLFIVIDASCSARTWPHLLFPLLWHLPVEYSTARKIAVHSGGSFRALQVFVLGYSGTQKCNIAPQSTSNVEY